jgi:integrase
MDPGESLWHAGAGSKGISSGTFYGRFRRYVEAAGLTPTRLHILRHTAAKLRREAGASIEEVSSFLDHSSLVRISLQSDHPFRSNPISRFGGFRSPAREAVSALT